MAKSKPNTTPDEQLACSFGTPWLDHFAPKLGTGKGCPWCDERGFIEVGAIENVAKAEPAESIPAHIKTSRGGLVIE